MGGIATKAKLAGVTSGCNNPSAGVGHRRRIGASLTTRGCLTRRPRMGRRARCGGSGALNGCRSWLNSIPRTRHLSGTCSWRGWWSCWCTCRAGCVAPVIGDLRNYHLRSYASRRHVSHRGAQTYEAHIVREAVELLQRRHPHPEICGPRARLADAAARPASASAATPRAALLPTQTPLRS